MGRTDRRQATRYESLSRSLTNLVGNRRILAPDGASLRFFGQVELSVTLKKREARWRRGLGFARSLRHKAGWVWDGQWRTRERPTQQFGLRFMRSDCSGLSRDPIP